MKKTIIIALVTAGFSVAGFSQGSIGNLNNASQYVTTGVGQTDPTGNETWYAGGLTLEVFFSDTATAGNIATINAFNGTAGGGAAALAALSGFGFSEVSLTGNSSSPVGSVSGSANSGNTFANFNTIDLSTLFASATTGDYALYFVGAGAFSNYSGVDAFAGNYGGQQVANPLGTPFSAAAAINGIPENLDLTAPVATPEPGTMALAGLGSLSLLFLRRKK